MKTVVSGSVLSVDVRKSKKDGSPFGIVKIFDGEAVLDVLVNVQHVAKFGAGLVVEDLPVYVNARLNQGSPALGVSTPADIDPSAYISSASALALAS